MTARRTIHHVFREVSRIDPSRGLSIIGDECTFRGELVVVVWCHGCGMKHYVPKVIFNMHFVCGYCAATFNLVISKPENKGAKVGKVVWV